MSKPNYKYMKIHSHVPIYRGSKPVAKRAIYTRVYGDYYGPCVVKYKGQFRVVRRVCSLLAGDQTNCRWVFDD
jgi:hypothetical protein